jgi:diguanylate cyclase
MNMSEPSDILDLHLQLGLLQTLDVGLVVVDRDYNIKLWNVFMENHSGIRYLDLQDQQLFEAFPELPTQWFKHKVDSVFLLKNRSFITWEQRPYLFQFKSYRPITGEAAYMYQNVTLIPLTSPSGETDHIGILIYDVTDTAVSSRALESANQKLRVLSETDPLTGLYNRGFWEARLKEEFARFSRSQAPSSLIMLDIDFFKKINDQYGHLAGDVVLKNISLILTEATRATDFVGRYGGEEFGILLTDTRASQAKVVINRIQERIRATLVDADGHKIRYSISLGLTEIHPMFQSHEQWIKLADEALYQSKENGRDRMTMLSPD